MKKKKKKMKSKVLRMYKKIMRTGKNWEKISEREYIQTEARRLFRQNKEINDLILIETKLHEAETRYIISHQKKIYFHQKI